MRRTVLVLSALVLGGNGSELAAQEDENPELRGYVISAVTGEPIAGAWIQLEGWEVGTVSRRDGRFRHPDVPNQPARYGVSALGYRPSNVVLVPDSMEIIELNPDVALQPALAFLFDHLDKRRRGGRVFHREVLAFSGAFDLTEFLATRGVRGISKYCLDERWIPGISEAPPEHFYILEIHGRTARLYTEEFLEETAREGPDAIEAIIRAVQPIC